MQDLSETTYSPVVDPRDLTSIPNGLAANDELHVPLAPRRGCSLRAPPWLRRLQDQHRLVLSFCYSDHQLLRWDAAPGHAEEWVTRIAPHASLTLDVPLYGFMSAAQRGRALARAAAGIVRAVRTWEPAGIQVIPLIKGMKPEEWEPQFELAAQLGLQRAAFYGRECLLERDEGLLRSFLKAARLRRLRPLLVGVFTARPPRDGAFDAAASYHYVLARRRRILNRAGRATPLFFGSYSELLGRFVSPTDCAALTTHNFLRARRLVSRGASLASFGFNLT